jgi:hypothetical protein
MNANNSKTMSVAEAIETSIREDRIVWIEASEQVNDDILAECDDSVDCPGYTEYWGETADGEDWRIHVTN